MNRTTYRRLRRLVRENGRFSIRWMDDKDAAVFTRLLAEQDSRDRLAERADIIAYCQREGLHCNVRHTQ